MSPDDLIAFKASLGLSWERLAPMLGRTSSQLRRWAMGSTPIPHWVPGELARIRAKAGKIKKAKRGAA
jgi:hypothetical protein